MPRSTFVRLTLAIIALAALGGCGATFRSHRVTPPELAQEELPWIGGAFTVDGVIVHFDQEPARNRAGVVADSLHGFVDGLPVAIALADVTEVWVLRNDAKVVKADTATIGPIKVRKLPRRRRRGGLLRDLEKAVTRIAGICFTVTVVYVTVKGIGRISGW
jgi:hypothetical protein